MAKGWFNDDCPETVVRLENVGTNEHPIYEWIVVSCPFCGNEHRHTGGNMRKGLSKTLGSRIAHCEAGMFRQAEYVLVRQKDEHKPISTRTRFQILSRDGFHCAYCGRGPEDGVKLHVDHKIPKSRGGSNDWSNLVTSCADCNLGKGAMYDKQEVDAEAIMRQVGRPSRLRAERIVWPTRAERSE